MRLEEDGGGVCEAAAPVVRSAMIVGGGIGGLAAALALRRVGVQVQVSEGAADREEKGSFEREARRQETLNGLCYGTVEFFHFGCGKASSLI